MYNIDWNDYRHPKFLQSLNLTLNEQNILNLFLKRPTFRIDETQEHLQNLTLVSPRKNLNPSKLLIKEEVSIKT